MFGLGLIEICIIAVVALVFIGPQKLPGVITQIARFFVQMKRVANDVKSTFDSAIDDAQSEVDSLPRDKTKTKEKSSSQNLS